MKHSMMMTAGLMAAAAMSAASVARAAIVHEGLLDFGNSGNPDYCTLFVSGSGALTACGTTFVVMSQTHGDVDGVLDVQYSAQGSPSLRSLKWSAANYNDLYGVLFSDNGPARIDLRLTGTNTELTLAGFDMGAFLNATLQSTVTVYDLGTQEVLYSRSGAIGSGTSHSTFGDAQFGHALSSRTGLRIEWKDDATNVGIDNIGFSVTSVPEPSNLALLLAGLGVVGFVARRRV